jgi:hypothetical protein
MASRVTLHEYDTAPDLYVSLARIFGAEESNGTRWVKVMTADAVELVFFAPRELEPEPAE